MTCLKKLTSLNNCKLTMINFVVCFCGGSIPPQVTLFWILLVLFLFY
jgi:hypothetical protein